MFSWTDNGNVAPRAQLIGANTGISNPQSVTVDKTGKIYVANFGPDPAGGSGSITVYSPRGGKQRVANRNHLGKDHSAV